MSRVFPSASQNTLPIHLFFRFTFSCIPLSVSVSASLDCIYSSDPVRWFTDRRTSRMIASMEPRRNSFITSDMDYGAPISGLNTQRTQDTPPFYVIIDAGTRADQHLENTNPRARTTHGRESLSSLRLSFVSVLPFVGPPFGTR